MESILEANMIKFDLKNKKLCWKIRMQWNFVGKICFIIIFNLLNEIHEKLLMFGSLKAQSVSQMIKLYQEIEFDQICEKKFHAGPELFQIF